MLDLIEKKCIQFDVTIDMEKELGSIYRPFVLACSNEGDKELVELMMKNSVLKNIGSYEGCKLFNCACEYGLIEIAEMLMDKSKEFNIELNERDPEEGCTVFQIACQNGYLYLP